MASRDIFPTTEVELAAWLVRLVAKIGNYTTALAIPAADIATLKADVAMIDWAVKAVPSLRASAQQFKAFKDDLLAGTPGGAAQPAPAAPTLAAAPAPVPFGAITRTRALIQRIKGAPGYTDAIGKDLEITTPSATTDASPKPTFKHVVLPSSSVRLDWVKRGHTGVFIQCKRAGDADWVDLGQDNYSPYVDERPPVTAGASETRQYRMRYVDRDEQVGDWSDVVSVVTTP